MVQFNKGWSRKWLENPMLWKYLSITDARLFKYIYSLKADSKSRLSHLYVSTKCFSNPRFPKPFWSDVFVSSEAIVKVNSWGSIRLPDWYLFICLLPWLFKIYPALPGFQKRFIFGLLTRECPEKHVGLLIQWVQLCNLPFTNKRSHDPDIHMSNQ